MRVGLKPGPGQVSRVLTTFSPAAQELQLLEAGSSVVNCLLEGAVQLGSGSVLQHCHLQVRPESRGRGQARLWGPGPVCVGGCLERHGPLRMPALSLARAPFTSALVAL